MGILLNRLLILLNDSKPGSIEYHIAFTMLRHFYELSYLTIGEVAELCNVSKGKISKFVRALSFEDYSEFRAASIFKENKYGFNLNYNLNIARYIEAHGMAAYMEAIHQDLTACMETIDHAGISRFVADLIRFPTVASLGVLFSEGGALDLQMKLAYNGKFILTYLDDVKQEAFIQQADEETLLIVYSNSGEYMKKYQLSEFQIRKNLAGVPAKIALITSNDDMYEDPSVDHCICFPHTTRVQTHGIIYQVINDMIIGEYRRQMQLVDDPNERLQDDD